MDIIAGWLRLTLEIVAGLLLVLLTALVTYAATIRLFGFGLAWYDEVAPIILTWITFFGAALVALHRGHLGFDNVVRSLQLNHGRSLSLLPNVSPSRFSWRWLGAASACCR